MSVKRTIAYNLKRIKKERGLTQFDIAEMSGLSTREIGKIERGQVSITVNSLEKLADGLRVPVLELIREE